MNENQLKELLGEIVVATKELRSVVADLNKRLTLVEARADIMDAHHHKIPGGLMSHGGVVTGLGTRGPQFPPGKELK